MEPPGFNRLVDEAGGRERTGGIAATRPGAPAASRGVVASTGTTASAPGGIGAPVAIRNAVPGATVTSRRLPGRARRR